MECHIGKKLKELRENSNLSRNQLAENINVTARAIQHYESNRRQPRANVLVAIADYFNVSVDWLLGRK